MYTIACILSYDGLPSMVPVESMDPQKLKADATDTKQGRRATGYISPGKFLISLISDKGRKKSHFHKNRVSMHGSAISTRSLPHASVDRLQQQGPPLDGGGSGGAASRIRSFKRQRESGPQ